MAVVGILMCARVAGSGAMEVLQAKPPSDEMVWGLAWNVGLGVLSQARGSAPDTVKTWRDNAELLAKALSVSLPPFPERGTDTPKDLAVAVEYILKSGAQPIAAALSERYDERHVALLEVGLKLPLLSVLYAPGDRLGRSTSQAIARAASRAGLPADLFKALFDKVDASADGKAVTTEILALRQAVLKHLQSQ